ncbi:glycosyltransferase family 32 protein [Dentipellis sp. KUC8613]|nr:glycosyltransferase family 32 protein [Dentipellis sp. KUC8613]
MSREYSRLPIHGNAAHFLRPRSIFLLFLKYGLPSLFLLVLTGFFLWEPHIELAFYQRAWVQKEIVPTEPLSGCFRPERVSPSYNISERLYGPRRNEVQAGMPLRLGLDCYDFAGTIQSPPSSLDEQRGKTNYHSYWRVDLAPFGERQEWMLKSFFATQPAGHSRFILWSNGDLSKNKLLQGYATSFPDSFELRVADVSELAKGTELEGSPLLSSKDKLAWTDGDLIRLLVLWKEGGVWVDMDSLLTRDLSPLLEHEFVTQWDCYDKIYQPLNGALMHFHQHSPYLCEAFHIMATSPRPRASSTDWGALLYLKLWRRLVAESVPPFKILPFCFSDARSCRLDNRLPDPFVPDPSDKHWTGGLTREADGGLDQKLRKVFAVHLHNQWEKDFPEDGWVRRLLLGRYEGKLSPTAWRGAA